MPYDGLITTNDPDHVPGVQPFTPPASAASGPAPFALRRALQVGDPSIGGGGSVAGPTAPNETESQIWVDTSTAPFTLRYWDGSTWAETGTGGPIDGGGP